MKSEELGALSLNNREETPQVTQNIFLKSPMLFLFNPLTSNETYKNEIKVIEGIPSAIKTKDDSQRTERYTKT